MYHTSSVHLLVHMARGVQGIVVGFVEKAQGIVVAYVRKVQCIVVESLRLDIRASQL